MNGFHFYLRRKDYFVVTDQTKKTRRLAEKVLLLMGCATTEGNIDFLLPKMQKAVCEIKTCGNGQRYYDIYGENFGGYGSWVDDGETVILYL